MAGKSVGGWGVGKGAPFPTRAQRGSLLRHGSDVRYTSRTALTPTAGAVSPARGSGGQGVRASWQTVTYIAAGRNLV